MSTLRSFLFHRRILIVGAVAVIVLATILLRTAPAVAGVALFNSLFAERVVEVKDAGPTQAPHDLHTITWNTFLGVVPEGAVVDSVAVDLTWSVASEREGTVPAAVTVPVIEEVAEPAAANEGETGEATPAVDEAGQPPILPEAPSSAVEPETPAPPAENETVPSETLVESTEEAPVEAEPTPAEEVEAAPATEEIQPAEPTAFNKVPTASRYVHQWAVELLDTLEAPLEAQQASAISGVPTSEVSETFIEIPEASTTDAAAEAATAADELTNEQQEAEPEVAPQLYPTLEAASVQYSLDGDAWVELGTIDVKNQQSASLKLPLEVVPAIDALTVRVVYLAPQDAAPVVFGNAQLALSYTFTLVEAVVAAPSDQEPNFEVSAVVQDSTKGGVRAVLLERGGVYELWGALVNSAGESVSWRKLASGVSLHAATPVAVAQGAVIWHDWSSQSLIAYEMKRASLTSGTAGAAGELEVVFGTEGQYRASYSEATSEILVETKRVVAP